MASSLLEDVLVIGGLGFAGYLLWQYFATQAAASAAVATATTTAASATPATTTATTTATPATTPASNYSGGPSHWGGGRSQWAGGGVQVHPRGPAMRIGNNVATPCTFTASDGTTQNGMMVNGVCMANLSAG
jgi:hypothetical protein